METSAPLGAAGTHCREPRRHGTGTSADHGAVCRRRITRCVRVIVDHVEQRHAHVCGGCSHVKDPAFGAACSIAVPVEDCEEVRHG
jgi:hypothetical protein